MGNFEKADENELKNIQEEVNKKVEEERNEFEKNQVKRKIEPLWYTARELFEMEFPPPRWAVPGLIAQGVTLLCGKPKIGKSFLALNLGVAIAEGWKALNKINVEKGSVLYLALEDTELRLKNRLVNCNLCKYFTT